MKDENPQRQATRPARSPRSWLNLAIPLAICVIAGVFCALLIVAFVRTRPMNLRDFSRQVAVHVEDLLATNRVPRENISRSEGSTESDARAVWTRFEIDVAVPPTLTVSAIDHLVRKNMPLQNVSVASEDSGPEHARTLHLSIAGRELVELRLTPERSQSDLRVPCERLAQEMMDILENHYPPLGSLDADDPVHQESPNAVWTLTRIRASLPDTIMPASIQSSIESALIGRNVRVLTSQAGGSATLLTLSYAGVDAIEIVLTRAEESPVQLPPIELPSLPALSTGAQQLPESSDLPLDSHEYAEPATVVLPVPSEEPASPAVPGAAPRVALIVDDGGYGGAVTEQILALDTALTLAILPYCDESRNTAARAAEMGFEVLLHMPMENHSKTEKFPGTIRSSMGEQEILDLTGKALDYIPQAAGANNHTGSKFTSDEKGMRVFLGMLQEKGLFFIDSGTTPGSIAYETARAMGIPSAQRDVFLDNESDADYIRGQFRQLMQIARKQGTAIGICHFRPVTAQVIAEMLPLFAEEGIRIVHASELVQ